MSGHRAEHILADKNASGENINGIYTLGVVVHRERFSY